MDRGLRTENGIGVWVGCVRKSRLEVIGFLRGAVLNIQFQIYDVFSSRLLM